MRKTGNENIFDVKPLEVIEQILQYMGNFTQRNSQSFEQTRSEMEPPSQIEMDRALGL